MRIQYLKHPDTPHWRHEPMVVLGEDQWGTWLGATPATWFEKGTDGDPDADPPTSFVARRATVQLINPTNWWTLIRNDGGRAPWYVDIVTPPSIEDDVVTMVDLDLDVIRRVDGETLIDDEDEFDIHRLSLGYSDRWVDMARATAAQVFLAVEQLDEPFGSTADDWLDQLREEHWNR